MRKEDWIPLSRQAPKSGEKIIACNETSTEFWAGYWYDDEADRAASLKAFSQCAMQAQFVTPPMKPCIVCRGGVTADDSKVTHWMKLTPP